MQRLKTRAQFQATMAGGVISRTAHFALHRLALEQPTGQEPSVLALFGVPGPWLGAVVPKRWARRAVTRNAIKRQVHAVSAALDLPPMAFVVRLSSAFDRKQFVSACSEPLKQAVRAELQQLFAHALRRLQAVQA
ncbi:MAG: ribonuclease P protein component [Acidovorax sp.]